MHAYSAAHLDHIRTEEVEILPLAERVLTGDWAELDAAGDDHQRMLSAMMTM
jgi:hypothetical protein